MCRSDDWLQTGILASVIHNEIDELRAIVVGALGGNYKCDSRVPADYIPGRGKRRRGTLRGKAMVEALKGMCR